MSKTVIRITPVGGFDIPGLENWFAVMAGKGLRFSMTTGPLTIFEKTAQQTVQIHLEPIRGAVNDDPELNALYEDAGWHYWGIFRGSFYVFASDDLTAQAHTDSKSCFHFGSPNCRKASNHTGLRASSNRELGSVLSCCSSQFPRLEFCGKMAIMRAAI